MREWWGRRGERDIDYRDGSDWDSGEWENDYDIEMVVSQSVRWVYNHRVITYICAEANYNKKYKHDQIVNILFIGHHVAWSKGTPWMRVRAVASTTAPSKLAWNKLVVTSSNFHRKINFLPNNLPRKINMRIAKTTDTRTRLRTLRSVCE